MAFASAATAKIEQWLLHAAHVSDGGASFTGGLAGELCAFGLPLWRLSVALLTKHPEVRWRNVQWHETDGVRQIERQHQSSQEPFFTNSPVALLVRGSAPIRVRLAENADAFPIC